ncbi:hypothetical protein HZR84_13975 [Hyphobacterium sp. CCMP332]|nr:hypothetical protein HZR84_13975 [Hyphobacterium sp. CCMP332]
MKKLTKSGILSIFLSLLIMAVFLACKDENESPNPSVNLPDATFELVSWDHINLEEINDYEAPASFKVTFASSVVQQMETWEKLEIDFGNGLDTVLDPYEGQNLYFVSTYYKKGSYTVTAKITNSSGTAEFSQTVDITPMVNLEQKYIDGFWSIIEQSVSSGNGGSTVQIEPYREFFHFGGGSYERWSLSWAEYESGSLAIDAKEIELTPSIGTGVTVIVDSFYRIDNIPVLAARTSMLDDDIGLVNYNLVLQLDQRFYLGGYPPVSVMGIFMDHKWSIIEQESWKYEFSDQSLQYNKIVENWSKEVIPYNHFTIEPPSYIIDNWKEGNFDVMNNYTGNKLTMNFINNDGDRVFLLFKAMMDIHNELFLWSTTFVDDGNETYRYETRSKLIKSDGSEAFIERDSLVGSWEITAKTETINGIAVDPGNSESPSVGDVLTLNDDGSANLGGAGEMWFVLDECNFVLLPDGGDTILVHLNSYDKANSEIEILTITNEVEDDYKLIFEMFKL